MAAHTSGAVRGYSWAQRGIGYSVVAAAAADALHPLADEVRRQIESTRQAEPTGGPSQAAGPVNRRNGGVRR
jgi:hypothetical protein